jgi:hypothetical protein
MNNKYLKQGIIEAIEHKISSKKSRATIEKQFKSNATLRYTVY